MMNTVCRKQKGRRVPKWMLPHFIRWQTNVDPHSKNSTNTHLVYNTPIDKHHTGPTELLHVWFHLNTTWDDSIWQVVIHERDLCKKTVRRTTELLETMSQRHRNTPSAYLVSPKTCLICEETLKWWTWQICMHKTTTESAHTDRKSSNIFCKSHFLTLSSAAICRTNYTFQPLQ